MILTWVSRDQFPVAHTDSCPHTGIKRIREQLLSSLVVLGVDVVKQFLTRACQVGAEKKAEFRKVYIPGIDYDIAVMNTLYENTVTYTTFRFMT